jgi:hypothetical protein
LSKLKKNLDDVWAKQLVLYGHLKGKDEERLHRHILNWTPTGRRKIGRPKTRWKEGVLRAIEDCGL